MLKRIFDLLSSLTVFLLLLPITLLIALLIIADSKGGVFYKQERIGKNGKPFLLWKFRTMSVNADQLGLITVGGRDPRVTRVGYYLRKYKLDELPQLINIMLNDMSVVGPRPEVKKYVALYTKKQWQVLQVKPGLTDLASLNYLNENELLGKAKNPEKTYIEEIMPAKLELNLEYIEKQSLAYDLRIIFKTISKIMS